MPKPILAAAGLVAMLVALRPADSRAEDQACDLVKVEVSPALDPRWFKGAEELRATLAHDLKGADCAPVRLLLEPSASGVVVRARSVDGRGTVRPLPSPQALVPVVLGLLATAPIESPGSVLSKSRDASSATQAPALPNVYQDLHDVPDFPLPARAEKTSPPSVNVAIGLSTGIRVGVPTDVTMWDSEAQVDVILRDWLIFALIRYAPLGAVSGIAADTDGNEELIGRIL